MPTSITDRSAPKASANPAPSAYRPRSPTRLRTPSACASPLCRSHRKRSTARSAPRRTTRSRTRMTPQKKSITFELNGRPMTAEVAPHHTVVELLQNEFDLFGARESCGQGLCGCCTVVVNGKAVSGCLYLAALVDGAKVQTVEGLAGTEKLDPVQEAFIEAGAFQCGFCTPGFVLMTKQLLDDHPAPDDQQIRHYLAGNL